MKNNEVPDVSNDNSQASSANIEQIKSVSMIWFVPFIALLIGAWMVYYQLSNEGPLITIAFDSAEGMEVGKTKIKSFNVDIGEVKSIVLNENADGVIVTARMAKNAEKLLNKNSGFWLVSPEISHTGISGLSTLISGVYIEFSPATIYEEEVNFLDFGAGAGSSFYHMKQITPKSLNCYAIEAKDSIYYNILFTNVFRSRY